MHTDKPDLIELLLRIKEQQEELQNTRGLPRRERRRRRNLINHDIRRYNAILGFRSLSEL